MLSPTTVLSMAATGDDAFGNMMIGDAPQLMNDAACKSQSQLLETNNNESEDDDASDDVEQKVNTVIELVRRKLKKAERERSYLFQERATTRRDFNILRRSISNNDDVIDAAAATKLEETRQTLERLKEDRADIEVEIKTAVLRLETLDQIKERSENKAKDLEEICRLVAKEFSPRA
jgi:hypothetical protein